MPQFITRGMTVCPKLKEALNTGSATTYTVYLPRRSKDSSTSLQSARQIIFFTSLSLSSCLRQSIKLFAVQPVLVHTRIGFLQKNSVLLLERLALIISTTFLRMFSGATRATVTFGFDSLQSDSDYCSSISLVASLSFLSASFTRMSGQDSAYVRTTLFPLCFQFCTSSFLANSSKISFGGRHCPTSAFYPSQLILRNTHIRSAAILVSVSWNSSIASTPVNYTLSRTSYLFASLAF